MNLILLRWIFILGFIFIINLLPLPSVLHSIMPSWILLLLFYTVIMFGMSWIWLLVLFAGLMLDVLQFSFLGEHVLALTLSLLVTKVQSSPLYNYSMDKQMYLIGMASTVYQLSTLLLCGLLHSVFIRYYFLQALISIVLSVLCWPAIKLFLDDFFDTKPTFSTSKILDQR